MTDTRGIIRSLSGNSVITDHVDLLAPESRCGGKARALAALTVAGLPVPDFVVVVDTELVRPEGSPPVSGWLRGEQVYRARIEENLLGRIHGEVDQRLRGAAGGTLAVRSSSEQEDARTASFAGQFRSFLGISSVADLQARLKQVWASQFLRRASIYGEAVSGEAVSGEAVSGEAVSGEAVSGEAVCASEAGTSLIPVILQRQVSSVAAGVVFTVNPTDPSEMLIEAVLGTGESLVGGSCDPDRITVDGTARREYRVGAKEEATLVLERHGALSCPVPTRLRTGRALTDGQVDTVVQVAATVQDVMGGPQDIEFAVDPNGKVWIVQARPITTAGRANSAGQNGASRSGRD
jgi:pyruvate,water dikinase